MNRPFNDKGPTCENHLKECRRKGQKLVQASEAGEPRRKREKAGTAGT